MGTWAAIRTKMRQEESLLFCRPSPERSSVIARHIAMDLVEDLFRSTDRPSMLVALKNHQKEETGG